MTYANPEFRKNIRLEFSLTRFLVPLTLLGLVIWIGWSLQDPENYYLGYYTPLQLRAEKLFGSLCAYGFLFSIVWGTYLAANSLFEEIKVKTWDFVRMSSLPPLKILTGKVFGATAVVWTVTILAGVPSILYAAATMIPEDGIFRAKAITVGILAASLVFWMIFSYSLALLAGLTKDAGVSRAGAFSATLLVMVVGLFIGSSITGTFHDFHTAWPSESNVPAGTVKLQNLSGYVTAPKTTEWYGFNPYNFDLVTLFLGFFSLWAFAGAWAALRRSLKYRDTPMIWVLFLASTSLLLNGLPYIPDQVTFYVSGVHIWALFVGVAGVYITCALEAGGIIQYRSFAENMKSGRSAELFRTTPFWVVSFAAVVIWVVLSFVSATHTAEAGLFLISLLGFMIRDILMIHVVAWTPNIRRPLIGYAIYLALVYVLLPILAGTIQSGTGYLFFPPVTDHVDLGFYCILLLLELVCAGLLFISRGRKVFLKADLTPLANPA